MMKKQLFKAFMKRCLVYISVVVFILPIFNNLIASATNLNKIYALRYTSIIPNSYPADWFATAFVDGVTMYDFGYFHRKVQEDIIDRNSNIQKEVYLVGSGKDGGKGRADLTYTINDVTYVSTPLS